jgi:hypothetical protein
MDQAFAAPNPAPLHPSTSARPSLKSTFFTDDYMNGRFVGFLLGKNDLEEFFVPVNQEYFNSDGSRNTLSFVCPNAVKPAEVGAGPDQRALSFAFITLSLRESSK